MFMMPWWAWVVLWIIAFSAIVAFFGWNKDDMNTDSSEHLPRIPEEGNSEMDRREEELMGQIGRGEF